jgi:hypothetical protein
MFTYQQTKQIKTAAESQGLELWGGYSETNASICNLPTSSSLRINTTGSLKFEMPRKLTVLALTLDNLLPWVDKHFGEIESLDYTNAKYLASKSIGIVEDSYFKGVFIDVPKTLAQALKIQAMELYYSEPQTLTDMICEAIINFKK